MSYYANGELKIVYLSTDKDISDKVENAFLYINQRYDMDCDVSEDRTVIEAWGNELYSTAATEKLLELLFLKTVGGKNRTARSFTTIKVNPGRL